MNYPVPLDLWLPSRSCLGGLANALTLRDDSPRLDQSFGVQPRIGVLLFASHEQASSADGYQVPAVANGRCSAERLALPFLFTLPLLVKSS